jgi:hypothetical protein
MGLQLSWNDGDRIQHGLCGVDEKTVTRLIIPGQQLQPFDLAQIARKPVNPHAEVNRGYAIWNESEYPANRIEVPPGKRGYAVEFVEWTEALSLPEIRQRLTAFYSRRYQLSAAELEECIDKSMKSHEEREQQKSLASRQEAGGATDDPRTLVCQFVRWLTREEYDQVVSNNQDSHGPRDTAVLSVQSRWDTLTTEEKEKKCGRCPLDTSIRLDKNPEVERVRLCLEKLSEGQRERLLTGLYKALDNSRKGRSQSSPISRICEENPEIARELARLLLDAFKGAKKFLPLADRLYDRYGSAKPSGCDRGSVYTHWSSFFTYLNGRKNFSYLNDDRLPGEGEIPVEHLRSLRNELTISRDILERGKIAGLRIYDRKGVFLEEVRNATDTFKGNATDGYGIGFEEGTDGIVVIFQGSGVLGLPIDVIRAVSEEHGIDGILRLNSIIEKKATRMYFSEIVREGNTFYGIMCEAAKGRPREGVVERRIELPPHAAKGRLYTPFDGLENSSQLGRIVFVQSSAWEAFGYLQNLLEKYCDIASRYKIPIVFH